jgi:hypothetical protein
MTEHERATNQYTMKFTAELQLYFMQWR